MNGCSRKVSGALLVAALLVAGCSDGTGPGEPFDPARTEADLAVLGTVMEGDEFQAFTAMSAYFQLGGAVPLASVSSARALLTSSNPASEETARKVAIAAAEALALKTTEGGAPSLEVLPPSVFGTTFEFDTASGQYVASSRTGAPNNGVRFIIYAVDPFSGDPIVDTEVGYADLIDTSVGSQTTAGLRLLLVGGGTTYLDYAFSARGSGSSAILEVQGYLTDGTTRLNFDVGATMSFSQTSVTIDVNFAFAIPSRQFSLSGEVNGIGSSTSGAVDIAINVVSGGCRVRYDVTMDDTTMNATIYVNGSIFATLTGDPNAPAVAGAGGADLTAEEEQVLIGLLFVAEGAFEFLGELLAPVSNVGGGF